MSVIENKIPVAESNEYDEKSCAKIKDVYRRQRCNREGDYLFWKLFSFLN